MLTTIQSIKGKMTISPLSQRYARCEKFVKGMQVPMVDYSFNGIVTLDKSFATSSLAAYRKKWSGVFI